MRIAYISTDFGIPIHGNKGASIHVRELALALVAQGHQVDIFTSRRGGDAPLGFPIPVHEIRLSGTERRLIASLQDDPDASDPVAKEIRSILYSTSFRQQARTILESMRPDAIYERYALHGAAGVELARNLGIPHILEVNAPLSEEHARHRGIAFAQTIRSVERHVLAAADEIIAVSEPLRQWIVRTGVDMERVTVVPNGVNVERFAAPNGSGRPRFDIDNRPVIGFVGTLKTWHGTATLIRAIGLIARERGLAQSPRLLIVGDGPERENLEGIAREEGISDLLTITGLVPHDDMPAYIKAMDIAVAPYDATPDFYFSPLKLFEYMAAGRPIIAAAIGQIARCIEDGVTGLLYPAGDIPGLAHRIGILLDHPEQAYALGCAAQSGARDRHGWDRNARSVAELIEREHGRRSAIAQPVESA